MYCLPFGKYVKSFMASSFISPLHSFAYKQIFLMEKVIGMVNSKRVGAIYKGLDIAFKVDQ